MFPSIYIKKKKNGFRGIFCYSGSEHNIYVYCILGLPQSHCCWHCLAHKDCTHQVLSSAWVIISQHYLLSQQYYACSTNSFGGNAVKYRFWTAGLFNPVCKINNVNYCMCILYIGYGLYVREQFSTRVCSIILSSFDFGFWLFFFALHLRLNAITSATPMRKIVKQTPIVAVTISQLIALPTSIN